MKTEENKTIAPRKPYPSDLTDKEWEIISPYIPICSDYSRKEEIPRREIVNAIFYRNRTGCQWRALPHDFPAWGTVSYYFYQWVKKGIWKKINDALRPMCREEEGRNPLPSAAIVDSQSAKTTQQGGERGFDGNKKVNGRKRHILVDVTGLLIAVIVLAANISDAKGLEGIMKKVEPEIISNVNLIWADQAYKYCRASIKKEYNINMEITSNLNSKIESNTTPGMKVIPRRWVVERTFGWLSRFRLLSKEYCRLPRVSEATIYASTSAIMVRRLAKNARG